MNHRSSYEIVSSYMPASIKQAMQKVSFYEYNKINEVRVRVNKPVCFVFTGGMRCLNYDGTLSTSSSGKLSIIPSTDDVDYITRALCKFSVHSCSRELSQGFFTIENGIRVGVAGTLSNGAEPTLKYISSLNFRISRQAIGCADQLFSQIFSYGRKSVIICGGVNSGKTTLLRDLCRLCGNSYKVALIDERSELAATVNGVSSNEVGLHTDILDCYRRDIGIITAVRSLSPHIIFCDEISTNADSDAIMTGVGCGVNFVASIHAECFDDLRRRLVLKKLLDTNVFDYAVILEGEKSPGKVKEIRRLVRSV